MVYFCLHSFIFNSSLMYYILTEVVPPPCNLFPHFLSHPDPLLLHFFFGKHEFPRYISTSSCNKSRQIPSIRLEKETQQVENFPKAGKTKRPLPLFLVPLLGVPQKQQATQPCIYAENLGQKISGFLIIS